MRNKSRKIFEDSLQMIPGGVNSPVRAFTNLGIHPLIAERASGDTLWDVDGNAYIDYCMSWGALILGHAHSLVSAQACAQIEKGSSYGVSTELEKRFASEITRLVPSIEKVRCVSSGTEATMSALRLARGFTNRTAIVKFNGNYHGHADSLLVQAGSGLAQLNARASSLGVPEDTIKHTYSLPYNATDEVRSFLRGRADIAAVIVEPIAGNMGLVAGTPDFLQMLRTETERTGALLLFDEVISGFRVGLQGVQGLHAITPDLTCLGKIIGAGFPIAAFGGKKEIMDHLAPLGQVYQAGTLSGNPVSIAAGLCALEQIQQEGFYEQLEEKAAFLTDPIREWIETHDFPACLNRAGSFFTLFFGPRQVKSREDLQALNPHHFNDFFRTLLQRGVYFPPSQYEVAFISSAHTYEHLAYTRDVILEFLRQL